MSLINKHLPCNSCGHRWLCGGGWIKMTITLKSQYTLHNIDEHVESPRGCGTRSTLIRGGVDSQRECRKGSSLIETEVFSLQEDQGFSVQRRAICAVCHRRPAAFICDSCEQKICESCTLHSSLLPLSRFCSEECKSEAETAADHVRESDPYTQQR